QEADTQTSEDRSSSLQHMSDEFISELPLKTPSPVPGGGEDLQTFPASTPSPPKPLSRSQKRIMRNSRSSVSRIGSSTAMPTTRFATGSTSWADVRDEDDDEASSEVVNPVLGVVGSDLSVADFQRHDFSEKWRHLEQDGKMKVPQQQQVDPSFSQSSRTRTTGASSSSSATVLSSFDPKAPAREVNYETTDDEGRPNLFLASPLIPTLSLERPRPKDSSSSLLSSQSHEDGASAEDAASRKARVDLAFPPIAKKMKSAGNIASGRTSAGTTKEQQEGEELPFSSKAGTGSSTEPAARPRPVLTTMEKKMDDESKKQKPEDEEEPSPSTPRGQVVSAEEILRRGSRGPRSPPPRREQLLGVERHGEGHGINMGRDHEASVHVDVEGLQGEQQEQVLDVRTAAAAAPVRSEGRGEKSRFSSSPFTSPNQRRARTESPPSKVQQLQGALGRGGEDHVHEGTTTASPKNAAVFSLSPLRPTPSSKSSSSFLSHVPDTPNSYDGERAVVPVVEPVGSGRFGTSPGSPYASPVQVGKASPYASPVQVGKGSASSSFPQTPESLLYFRSPPPLQERDQGSASSPFLETPDSLLYFRPSLQERGQVDGAQAPSTGKEAPPPSSTQAQEHASTTRRAQVEEQQRPPAPPAALHNLICL
ncbi:unnamed protein product, partial [Amoebophrya sp. A25]